MSGTFGGCLPLFAGSRLLSCRCASSSIRLLPIRHGPCAQIALPSTPLCSACPSDWPVQVENVRLQKSILVKGRLIWNSATCQPRLSFPPLTPSSNCLDLSAGSTSPGLEYTNGLLGTCCDSTASP